MRQKPCLCHGQQLMFSVRLYGKAHEDSVML